MRLLLLLLTLGWATFSYSVTVSGLYRVSVPVADQTSDSRSQAAALAFDKVLIKVSGTGEVLQNDMLQSARSKAESYISSLRYERDAETSELSLVVEFMAMPLQKLLETSGAPVWGSSRPLTALWLVEDTENERTAVSLENDLWAAVVSDAMAERGVPVLYPAWDLDDEIALSLPQLWGLFEDDIAKANERYSSDGYLAGRILGVGDEFSFAGYAQFGEERLPLQTRVATAEELASWLSSQLAEHLSSRYAVIALPEELAAGGHIIRISGVNTFPAYRGLVDYLSSHVAIRGTRVLSVQGEVVTLSLDTLSSWAQAWDVLALDKKLAETEEAGSYVWLP